MPKATDPAQEKEALCWIEAVVGEPVDKSDFATVLKDGVLLCKLMEKLTPNSIKSKGKINTKGGKFALMENLEKFQKAAKEYGLPQEEIFQSVDLIEKKNLPQVCLCIHSLGRMTQTHPEYQGPRLGPKMSDENVRHFTEEQLADAKNAVGLQAGYAGGASQAGMNMGKRRMIQD